jgi:hypothetical protein
MNQGQPIRSNWHLLLLPAAGFTEWGGHPLRVLETSGNLRPITWPLGVIVGMTVLAFLVIWMLVGLARHMESIRIPFTKESRLGKFVDDKIGIGTSLPSVNQDPSQQGSEESPLTSEIPSSTGETVASQSRFELEAGE